MTFSAFTAEPGYRIGLRAHRLIYIANNAYLNYTFTILDDCFYFQHFVQWNQSSHDA